MARPVRKRKKHSALFAPISFLLICAALVFGLSVFFRVASIEVLGVERYTPEEVISASGLEPGDNLFFVNRSSAISRIYARLPYVETAEVELKMPNRLTIHITESKAVACVTAEDGTWAIDRNCKLLSRLNADQLTGLIRVRGLTPIAPAVGQIIAPGEAETPKVQYLAAILRQMTDLDMTGDVRSIDISNVANPSFDYLGRFNVKLGSNENVEYKFQCLLSAVDALAEGDRGTLDLSIDRQAHLTYG